MKKYLPWGVALLAAGGIVFAMLLPGGNAMQESSDGPQNTAGQNSNQGPKNAAREQGRAQTPGTLEVATLGSGCFWCTEGVFQQVNGVQKVVSGYSGGKSEDPTYEEVCSGASGHAEVVQVTFDPSVISYAEILEIFWRTHDPTTLNRQGNDVGTQYRSAVFYHSAQQRQTAEEYKRQLDASGSFGRPIVTEIVPYHDFYAAENYHQNYYAQHGNEPYCQLVVRPKVEKFRKQFKDKLKTP